MGDGKAGHGKRSDWALSGGYTSFHELHFELERGRAWAGIQGGGVAHDGVGSDWAVIEAG